jgi:acetyl-CoA synthetase
VAVVGATEREGSYGGQTVLNLAIAGYEGDVWPVNPNRARVYDLPCFPSLADLPSAADAVVVSVPAVAVPAVIEEAGVLGSGGAVVIGAGFGEVAAGRALERELAESARRHGLPVCGPNCNGIVGLHDGVALWGDALNPLEPGEVALVSQSGNVAVNALATSRGLRLHTVVSCGNQAVLEAADWLEALADEEGLRAVALYLEADGDGARLCDALARCAERDVRVAVLKVGASVAGAAAAAAHTGAVAGDHRVFRALVEETGAAWADDVHELLELAKALGVDRPPRPPDGGLAVLTCSGGDSSLAADEAERLGLELPPLAEDTRARLRELLPEAATVGNPLDYTALIWGETELLRDIVAATGRDPAIDRMLVLYDQPVGITGAPAESWEAVLDGILAGAAASPAPTMVASTLPELLDDGSARRLAEAGVPAIAGLRTGLNVARALGRAPGDPVRIREIASAAVRAPAAGDGWLAEHEAKELLRSTGLPVVDGRVAESEDDAAAALAEIGAPVALKLSAPSLRHKSEAGALALDLGEERELRDAHRRLSSLALDGAAMLVERMAAPGLELLVAVRADAVVPALVIGLGGVWVEVIDDVAVVPLPAGPERVLEALHGLRTAPLLTGGRGRPALDTAAAAALASAAGDLLLERGLSLIELNPVLVYERGAVVVDAAARA